ncbi:hypothetical protein HA050_05705 [Iodobacter sp. HSC-16F04]|uniref:Uncharacterized protein n=1 Tax=Iodobacter violaceini TaxID=3044271 RepID=A0ABX0KMQ0_9NEIS|nr:hypothetical protein [Iodobacter violacea]NHQ85613.1 hypothetical protein [Iodobacter violacea]
MIELKLNNLTGVWAGILLLFFNIHAFAAGNKVALASAQAERVLAKPLFHAASAAHSAPLVIDRRLFRQLSVAPDANVLPDAKAKRAEKKRAFKESAMASALRQYKKEDNQRRKEHAIEASRKQASVAIALKERGCDQPTVNQSACIAAVNQLSALGALMLPTSSAGVMGGFDSEVQPAMGVYCDDEGNCDTYTY